MKKILLGIAAMALAAPLLGQDAPVYAAQGFNVTATNCVAAASTATINQVFDVRKQKDVAVQISFLMSSTGTGNQTLTFQRSIDNSNWESETAKKTVIVIAATGATKTTTVTNIPTEGAGYIRLATWQNGQAGQYATNIACFYGLKISTP